MKANESRRMYIGEVGKLLDLPPHVLRQWEAKFPQIRPRRDRAKNRYYTDTDVEILRRVKFLVRHEKMTLDGARLWLAQELHGTGRPRTQREAVDLVDRMESEIRQMFDLLDSI